jgi:tRNA threonylcarbamoyladenosine biosynthesis protein TsaE
LLTASFLCESPEQTILLGRVLGEKASPGEIWNLSGPLGAGKTLWVKGLAEGLGVQGNVTSPTFTLQHIYQGRLPLFHFDWYRLKKAQEVEDLGFGEWLEKGGVVAVEWGDKFPHLMPAHTVRLQFEPLEAQSRRILVEATHPDTKIKIEELVRCWPL